MHTYLLINLFTILFPFLYSFERRVAFYRQWKYWLVSTATTAAFFITWDYLFTAWGVWHFNPAYVMGIELVGLPMEEWLFFFTIPYACIFIYEILRYYWKWHLPQRLSRYITWALIILLLAVALTHLELKYTTFACFFTAVMLFLQLLLKARYMSLFYLMYLFHLIPFFIVNGILTALPVVIYNDAENLGIRLGTIPIEDSIYSMLLLLMNITIYERLQKRLE